MIRKFFKLHRFGVLNLLLVTMIAPASWAGEHIDLDPAAARKTAVALNYCRASFHRLQRTPSKRVLLEEQEKVLNNLNLNGIADAEVIRLYTAVLGEISEVQIAEQERQVIQTAHRRAVMRDISLAAFGLSTQLATAQYQSALQTGARSWWDYRSHTHDRELQLWRIEKERLQAVADKSFLFLDTFWKLARKRNIPDHWLVRGNDLDQLAEAINEERPEVRLRILGRMERFMECFPPYYYYVGRTQQELGQWTAAAETYQQLASFGDDNFRRDEMLAAALCNQAMIQEYLEIACAPDTARAALRQATDAWEVNLQCGMLLARQGETNAAEDAILRNLDVGLESSQSRTALLSVYSNAKDTTKLAKQLSHPETVEAASVPILLGAIGTLGTGQVPKSATVHLTSSLRARFERRFGLDDLVIEASRDWKLDQARMAVRIGDKLLTRPMLAVTNDGFQARFSRVAETGTPIQTGESPDQPMSLVLQFPQVGEMTVYLEELSGETVRTLHRHEQRRFADRLWPSERSWRVTAIDHKGARTLFPTATAGRWDSIPIAGAPQSQPVYRRSAKPVRFEIAAPLPDEIVIEAKPFKNNEELPVVRPY
ncbi:tetratricopeptide repeat protein [Thalassoroseus pseudoceratinae]|uniref:hypothetical protein n=1 Tax=Thalassoroseus pseudoceratinae TaxID=2713176 RepID=UPI001420DBBD|nr:hypothetical protein [Thalassoroseus pseudoceratinae]